MQGSRAFFDEAVKNYLIQWTYLCRDRSTGTGSSWFDEVVVRLQQPPRYTTLRLNNLNLDVKAVADLAKVAIENQYADRGLPAPKAFRHPLISDLLLVENIGPQDGRMRFGKEIIVDVLCGTSVLRGANVFAQGVVSAPASLREGDPVSVYVDLSSTCLKGFAKPFDGPKLFVGNGRALLSRSSLFCNGGKSRGVAVNMTDPLYIAPRLSDLLPDLTFSQNLPSVVCGHVLKPQPGERVLDMCAAPGGKTTHLAALMRNEGTLIALDKSKSKLSTVEDNLKRWGLTCCRVYACDATRCCEPGLPDWCPKPPFPPESFDRILLDAPCSALGQRPCLRSDRSMAEVSSFPTLQRRLLAVAVQLLRPGGVLVYSTCTLPLAENEEAAAWALATFPCLSLAQQEPYLGTPGFACEGMSAEQLALLQRFDPTTATAAGSRTPAGAWDADTIGFFIAKFIKGK